MWVNRSPKEHRQFLRRLALLRLKITFLVFFCSSILLSVVRVNVDAATHGSFVRSPDEVLQAFPLAFMAGLIVSVFFFLLYDRKASLICQKCGAIKSDDGQLHCPCGGECKKPEDIKWVDASRN